MKQVSIALNVIFIAALIAFSCSHSSKSNNSTSTGNPPCPDCSNSSFQGISAATAHELANNYHSAMHNDTDSRCIWFSLDTIKAFICAIEKVNSNNCNKNFKLGIRFYYGRYPGNMSGTDFFGLDSRYPNKHTLFLVPTYLDGSVNRDFDPSKGLQQCEPEGFDSKSVAILASASSSPPPHTTSNEAKNHGDLIPPKSIDGATFLQPTHH